MPPSCIAISKNDAYLKAFGQHQNVLRNSLSIC